MRALILALLLAGCATVAPVPPPPAPKVVVEAPKAIVTPKAPLRYQTESKKCKPVCQLWQGRTLCDDVCR